MRPINLYTAPNLILTLTALAGGLLLLNFFHPITTYPKIQNWESSGLFLILGLVGGGLFFLLHACKAIRRHRLEYLQEKAKRKLAELELLSVRAQLNPHFIFNSLGSIQYYIRNSAAEAAENQLTKFSKLLRLVLESFSNPFNTLEKEIDLIKLYCELEQIRFENRFKIFYEIDKNLNLTDTLLPALLLQPFVENAISKGLFHKKEKGFLKIGIFEAENGDLQVVLEHNGIKGSQLHEDAHIYYGGFASTGSAIAIEKLKYLNDLEGLGILVNEEYLTKPGLDAITRINIIIPEIE